MELTYARYLKLDELLSLQQARSIPPQHDELLFIVIHQSYELWFKLLIHEFQKIKQDLSADRLFPAIATLKRVRTVMKSLVQKLDILETMTPNSFSAFRERLDTASGFQSIQFRELEFMLGFKRQEALGYYGPDFPGYSRLVERLEERSVFDHFLDFIEHRGVAIPEGVRGRDPKSPIEANEEIQEGLLELYRRQPEVQMLIEMMTDFDEGWQEWRYRHVKLVERTIGNKHGTGGSLGVEFLKKSLFKPLFPDLWAIRHRF